MDELQGLSKIFETSPYLNSNRGLLLSFCRIIFVIWKKVDEISPFKNSLNFQGQILVTPGPAPTGRRRDLSEKNYGLTLSETGTQTDDFHFNFTR